MTYIKYPIQYIKYPIPYIIPARPINVIPIAPNIQTMRHTKYNPTKDIPYSVSSHPCESYVLYKLPVVAIIEPNIIGPIHAKDCINIICIICASSEFLSLINLGLLTNNAIRA
jgi:hypothetical protein